MMKLRLAVIMVCFIGWSSVRGQDGQMAPESLSPDTVVFHNSYFGKKLTGTFSVPTENSGNLALMVYNTRYKRLGGIYVPYDEGTSVSLSLPVNGQGIDTVIFVLKETNREHLKYPPVTVYLTDVRQRKVVFGKRAVEVDCIVFQEPYIPQDSDPVLISLEGYYLNPVNGRIVRGSRAVQLWDQCELKNLIFIAPDRIYTDRNKTNKSGRALIKKKRIRLSEWDLKEMGW